MKTRFTSWLAIVLIAIITPVYLFAQKPVSFIYHQSLIFVRVQVNDKKDLLFLMDTGANTTAVDRSVAELLKLPVIKEADTVIGTAGKEHISICKAKKVQIGSTIVNNLNITSRDLSRFLTPKNEKLKGILGTDFMKKYAITIDYSKRTLVFGKTTTKAPRQKSIAFDMHGGIPRFEARLNDTLTTYLNFNSGVSIASTGEVYINVSHRQWATLKNNDKYLTPYTYMHGDGVGGRVQLPVVKIRSAQFNGVDVVKPSIVVQPREGYFIGDDAVGFFGNNLMEKYRKVTVDFPKNKVILHSVNGNVAVHQVKKR